MKIALKTLAASVWAATLMGSQSAMAQPVDALEVNDYVYVNSTGDNQTADVTVCDNFFSPSGCWYMSYNWLGTGDFTIYDLISGSTPFTIFVGEEEGVADNALVIDASGKVGVGTSTPGDTAGSRLTVGLNDLGDSSIFLPTPTANFALVNSGDYIGFGDNDAVSVPFGIDAGSDSNSLWVAPGGLVGVGTNDPAENLHVKDGNFKVEQTDESVSAVMTLATANSGWEIKQNGITGRMTFFSPGGGATTASFKFDRAAQENLLRVGVLAGDTVDINGKLVINGSNVTPDYVFAEGYNLESIEDHAEFMWKHKHLPALPGAAANENGVDIVGHQYGTLEELEKAHIYISQLDERLKQQDETIMAQSERIMQMEIALAKLLREEGSEL
jgi:hypothetical protein